MKKLEQLQLTLDNSKSEEGQGDYLDKNTKFVRGNENLSFECKFLNVLIKRDQVIENRLCL